MDLRGQALTPEFRREVQKVFFHFNASASALKHYHTLAFFAMAARI